MAVDPKTGMVTEVSLGVPEWAKSKRNIGITGNGIRPQVAAAIAKANTTFKGPEVYKPLIDPITGNSNMDVTKFAPGKTMAITDIASSASNATANITPPAAARLPVHYQKGSLGITAAPAAPAAAILPKIDMPDLRKGISKNIGESNSNTAIYNTPLQIQEFNRASLNKLQNPQQPQLQEGMGLSDYINQISAMPVAKASRAPSKFFGDSRDQMIDELHARREANQQNLRANSIINVAASAIPTALNLPIHKYQIDAKSETDNQNTLASTLGKTLAEDMTMPSNAMKADLHESEIKARDALARREDFIAPAIATKHLADAAESTAKLNAILSGKGTGAGDKEDAKFFYDMAKGMADGSIPITPQMAAFLKSKGLYQPPAK